MEETTKLLLQLVCSVLINEPAKDLPELDSETLESLYKLAQKHELAHLAGEGLRLAGAMPGGELGAKFRKQKMAAIYSDQTKCIALSQVDAALTAAQIPFIPLKGSVLRSYYPEPWMRSRCDIDVLVPRQQHDEACAALEAAGFQMGIRGYHDIPMTSPGGVHLELHYSLFSESDYVKASGLEDIWNSAKPLTPGSCCHVLEDAMFYCYHVSHMAKHLRGNGCGLRPFLDLWILNHQEEADHAGRAALLEKTGLTIFAETAGILAESWFDETVARPPIARKLEEYLIFCGIFGNEISAASNWRVTPREVLLERIFKPYSKMILVYPSLKKHPWLYPAYIVMHWCSVMRRIGILAAMRDWNKGRKIYNKRDKNLDGFMSDLGLSEEQQ